MQRNRLGYGAGAVLVAAALSGCGSSQTAEELAPERTTAAAVETPVEAPSASPETPAPATPSAASPVTADAPTAPAVAANTVAAVGPESGDAEEAARPRHRTRRVGAAVNSRTTLPVAEAPAVRETETRWTHPFPVSRAGIRWGGPTAEERPRVIRRQAAAPQQPAAPVAAPPKSTQAAAPVALPDVAETQPGYRPRWKGGA